MPVGRVGLPSYYEILTPPTIENLRTRWNVESYETQIDDYLYLAKEAKNRGNLKQATEISHEVFNTIKDRLETTHHYPLALFEFIDKYLEPFPLNEDPLPSNEFDLTAIFFSAYKLAMGLKEVKESPQETLSAICFKVIVLKRALQSAQKLKLNNLAEISQAINLKLIALATLI